MDMAFWLALGQIILINLILSGDNAAVIALAACRLEPAQRSIALWWGSLGAVGLRIGLTFLAAALLAWPGIQLLGGAVLLWVAYGLGAPEEAPSDSGEFPVEGRWRAIRTILVADVFMSLDNVLSLAGVARGDHLLLILGLLTSLPLVVVGSSLLLRIFERFPWLVVLGAALLAQVGGAMLASDSLWQRTPWGGWPHAPLVFSLVCAFLVGALRLRS
ncbi:YjbE family putative metal transport protein [Ferrovum sp.]|uniref:YjbE family putative metal transport protein n=1 Tax=Ferrovum sp. TaxID=2609467 RepID=UPI002620E463|nr:YjbE family putative metal transport protein [Ferrovum sp.]